MKPTFFAFWAINGELEPQRLSDQLRRFRGAGFDGVVWHPRFYPGEPPYLSLNYMDILSRVILEAKALGLKFWIYDEDGWPSGTVSGQMLARYPELGQRWAGLYRHRPVRCLAECEHAGEHWFLGENRGAGVDYLNLEFAPRFLELTHDRYAQDLGAEAFAHVEALFGDEPEFGLGHAYDNLPPDGAIPWTPDLLKAYADRYGESLAENWIALFFDTEESARVRVRFWELLRDRFANGYLGPIDQWCQKRGKLSTAHIKGEEHPLFQVPMVGSCSAVFRHLALPGIDSLERFPGNDFFPRQVVSSAHQFGNGRSMVEAFGGAGWGANPEDLERYLLWLGENGVTDFVLHLSQYRLDTTAIRDWPPSQPFHVTWAEAFPEMLRRVRAKLAREEAVPPDLLLVSPHRAIMATYQPRELLHTNIHNAAEYPDSPAAAINRAFLAEVEALQRSGRRWHVTDEATFEKEARVDRVGIRVGKQWYPEVRLAPGVEVSVNFVLPTPTPLGNREVAPVASSGALSEVTLPWRLAYPPQNVLLLPITSRGRCEHYARWTSVDGNPRKMTLRFADDVAEVHCNGEALAMRPLDDGCEAEVPAGLVTFDNSVQFRTLKRVESPYVWLEGEFRVVSATPYTAGANGTLRTLGPFATHPPAALVGRDAVRGGYPFLFRGLRLESTLNLVTPVRGLHFCGARAAALTLSIDGCEPEWLWGPDWATERTLAAGAHRLVIHLLPSAFNYYGPHHYYLGDHHLMSPDQFSGKKNFADPIDSPSPTRVPEWHFVRLEAPSGARLVR